MIVVVCADKGSPGVTTLSVALALAWPGETVLLEADPAGGDLSLLLRQPGTKHPLAVEPTTLSLATDVRSGAFSAARLPGYAQGTSLGIAVIPGPETAEAWTPMQHLWEPVVAALQQVSGTVIVDLGRLHGQHPGWAFLDAADHVLILTKATLTGLFHARERAWQVAERLGQAPVTDASHSRVKAVVRAGNKAKGALHEVGQVLRGVVPVVGGIADDEAGVKAMLAGTDHATRPRMALMRSAVSLVERIQRARPVPEAPAATAAATTPARVRRLRAEP